MQLVAIITTLIRCVYFILLVEICTVLLLSVETNLTLGLIPFFSSCLVFLYMKMHNDVVMQLLF